MKVQSSVTTRLATIFHAPAKNSLWLFEFRRPYPRHAAALSLPICGVVLFVAKTTFLSMQQKIKKWKYDWWRCSQSRHTHKCTHCSPQVWHIGCRLQDFQGALSRSCSQTSCCPCRWRLSCIRCCFNWPSPFSVLLFRLAHWHFLGTRGANKMVEFSEKFQRGCGGGGPFSIKKFILQILDL